MEPRRVYYSLGPKDCPLEVLHNPNAPREDTYFIRHWHSQMQFTLVESGMLRLFSLTGETDLFPGEIYLIPPEEVHGFYSLMDGSAYRELLFSPELITVPETHFFHKAFVSPLREGRLLFPRKLCPGDRDYDKILSILKTILNADKTADDYKPTVYLGTIALCLALIPLCQVVTEPNSNPLSGTRGNNVVHVVQRYLSSHYGSAITLPQLADQVHMHPNYLCKLFKEYTGQTIFECLTSIRISFATQFIRNSPKPLRQIAEECGFNSMSFFTKKFKLHTGLTPYAYSKLYKNR